MSSKRALWCGLCLSLLGFGCVAVDAPGNDEVASAEQPLWRTLDRGALEADHVVLDALEGGDIGHAYRFDATAGETVRFVVEWHQPEAWALGAAIALHAPSGARVAANATLWDERAAITYTFPASGAYRIVARPYGYALFGRYPYKVGAFRGTGAPPVQCVGVWLTAASVPGFDGYAAIELEPGEPEDPATWRPSWPEDLVMTEREVDPVPCTAIVDHRCGASSPEVCGSFPFIGPSIFANECEVRAFVRTMAAECPTCAGLGGWGDPSLCPAP